MNLLHVGELLKKERERRGISIRDVMDATKISRRNLTALEEGQVKSLPHPVYLKGYVRNIAKMVGLDPDELAQVVDQQYDAELAKYLPQAPAAAPAGSSPPVASPVEPEAPGMETAPAPKPGPAPEPEREPRQRFTPEPLVPPKPNKMASLRSIAALIVLVGILIGLIVQYQRMRQDAPPAPVEPPVAAINATAPVNATVAEDNATAAAPASEPASAEPAPAPAPEPVPAQAAKAPAPATPSAPTTSIEESRKAPVAEARTPGMQQLSITVKPDEVCWVQINDGQQARSFTLRNGETRQVEFSRRLSVRLGNAGGVSFRLNGQDYPFDGKRGSIETVEFGAR